MPKYAPTKVRSNPRSQLKEWAVIIWFVSRRHSYIWPPSRLELGLPRRSLIVGSSPSLVSALSCSRNTQHQLAALRRRQLVACVYKELPSRRLSCSSRLFAILHSRTHIRICRCTCTCTSTSTCSCTCTCWRMQSPTPSLGHRHIM